MGNNQQRYIFSIQTSLFLMMLITLMSNHTCKGCSLANAEGLGVSYKFTQNQQYIYMDNLINDSIYKPFVVRSLSITIASKKNNIVVELSKLAHGNLKFGDFYMVTPELDYEYHASNSEVLSPRFPIPFAAFVSNGNEFTINLTYPDVIDSIAVVNMICVYTPDRYTRSCGYIKENSINLNFGQHLETYAKDLFYRYNNKSTNLFSAPEIPFYLSDRNSNKEYYLSSKEYLQFFNGILQSK